MEIKSNQSDIRIDNYLMNILNISRNKVQEMIKEGKVKINTKIAKSGYKIKENDIIEYAEYKEESSELEATKMNLDIVFEDDNVIVINKPNGLVVHPGSGNKDNTLANGLKYYSKLSDLNGEFRPGIVHRIDAYTTGLLMIAKNNQTHEFLSKQLENKTTHRKYIALVWGVIKEDSGTIDAPIGRDKNDRKKMGSGQGIQVDEQRVQARVNAVAAAYEKPDEMLRWYQQTPNALDSVRALVLEDQVVDWVLERAQVSDRPSAFAEIMKPDAPPMVAPAGSPA